MEKTKEINAAICRNFLMALGHAARNATTAIYIERDRKKIDDANRRVIDWVFYGKK